MSRLRLRHPASWVLAMLGIVLAAGSARAEEAKTESMEAEMLRDLDVLANPDYAREREVVKRMRFLERLRMLESQRMLEAQGTTGGASPAPAPTPREVR